MDKQEIYSYILGGQSVEFFIAFMLFAFLGMLMGLILHYLNRRKKARKRNESHKFSWGYWFRDNLIRKLANLIAAFCVFRFSNDLPITYELDMYLGFVTGLSIDGIIILLQKIKLQGIIKTK